MSTKKYLVTGATGSTGKATVKYLRERGAEMLGVVHRDDERAEQLRAIGARTNVDDLRHFESVRNALQAVRKRKMR
jgi:NAD(P)H dehydrogenase (quinone)